jgi:hypothetical protein
VFSPATIIVVSLKLPETGQGLGKEILDAIFHQGINQVGYEIYEVNYLNYEIYDIHEEIGFFHRDVPVKIRFL